MTNIERLFALYSAGDLTKADYITRAYEEAHQHLFSYASFLPNTNISKIEILEKDIVFTFKDSGIKISCPQRDHRVVPLETLNFLDYEKEESWMIRRLVNSDDTVFDIGGNMGYYTILLALDREDATVHCFEPIPVTYQACLKNIALNGLDNVVCRNFGLSNKEGSFPFYFYPEGSGNASAVNVSERAEVITLPCELTTLDKYAQEVSAAPDFIKCDVEGGELLVFQGGQQTIAQSKPIVFTEILRKYCAKYDYNPNQIFEWFYDLGYEAFTVRNRELVTFRAMDASTTETNFFFLHTQKHSEEIGELCSR